MSRPTDVVFGDGNMTPVVRQGDEVRRGLPLGYQATHAVLRHLEARGFPFAPRLIRHDREHEWLSYMPGASLPHNFPEHRSQEFIEQVGSLIYRYHEAMADFVAPDGLEWPPTLRQELHPDTVCHNDIAPWNVIVDESGRITGLIDWDLVQPGKHVWDLAYAAWRFGIIGGDDEGLGRVHERANRIIWLLDAYGWPRSERVGFVDLLRERERAGFDVVEILGSQGVPGYAALYEKGAHHWGLPARYWLDEHHEELRQLVERQEC